jgi:hypothetical protein
MAREEASIRVRIRSITLDLEGYEGQVIRVKEDLPGGFLETAMGLFGISGTFNLRALSPKEAREVRGLLHDLRRDLANVVVGWDLRDPYDDEPLPQPFRNPEAFASLGLDALTGLVNVILSPPKEQEKNLSEPSSPTSTGTDRHPGPGSS